MKTLKKKKQKEKEGRGGMCVCVCVCVCSTPTPLAETAEEEDCVIWRVSVLQEVFKKKVCVHLHGRGL